MNLLFIFASFFILFFLLMPLETLVLIKRFARMCRDYFAKHCSPKVWAEEKDKWDELCDDSEFPFH